MNKVISAQWDSTQSSASNKIIGRSFFDKEWSWALEGLKIDGKVKIDMP